MSLDRTRVPKRTLRALLLTSAVLGGLGAAALAPAPAYAQAADAETLRQMKQELEALKAAEAQAKADERARAQRIDALAKQLARASGEAIVELPTTTELAAAPALRSKEGGPSFEIYGFGQADYIQDFQRVDPSWEGAFRPSKIPVDNGQFGDNGQSILSVRQSRFGARARQSIAGKDLFVRFEFDVFGTGNNAGETIFRMRHAYGSWGPILAGQTDTLFQDADGFPNGVDYWGPVGMVALRNPQIRYTFAMDGGHKFAVALEKPSNDIDAGAIRQLDPNLGANIRGSEKLPDLTGQYRYDGGWGHVVVAGILRKVAYETSGTPDNEPRDSKMGWGVNLSTSFKTWDKDVLRLAVVYGEGIASYMNDGGTDLGPKLRNRNGPPIIGVPPPGILGPKAVPSLGVVAFYDHYWNDQWSTSFGWSMHRQEPVSFQQTGAYENGQYASVNLLYTPDKRILIGGEALWGQRENNDGNKGEDTRLQFTFKYSFSSNDFLQ